MYVTNVRQQVMQRMCIETAERPVKENTFCVVVNGCLHLQFGPAHMQFVIIVGGRVLHKIRKVGDT